MSDIALKDAQVTQLLNENISLKSCTKNLLAANRAYKEYINELITQNLNLKSSSIVQENDLRELRQTLSQFEERIITLEKEKHESLEKIKEIDIDSI